MALNSSRSAWSLPRQPLRPLRASTSIITPTARPPCRRASHDLARYPTALRERNDRLNEPVSDADVDRARPRWSYTPEALKRRHDFSLNFIRDPRRAIFHVNDSPEKLDEFYERFLGRGGSRMLPEELRWLAVTHKSFDYGRRGFNTKLAYFGRQILVLETMNAIMARTNRVEDHIGDPWKREHFQSPALTNVDKLTVTRPQDFMTVADVAAVAKKIGLDEVTRWKPRNPFDLTTSGVDVVLTTTLYAIVGAISLQHGAEIASRVGKEKVLARITRKAI